ncbi:MAG TPA: aromatic ring-hydroxylating dioxygenase subunit alpha [Acidimicrobiia bacterium]
MAAGHLQAVGGADPAADPDRRVAPVGIPTSRYTSPDFARLEMERLWPRVWQLACTVDQVANPGDWHEYRIGPYSVLVVRGDDGELRAFQNACRHRGSALCEGSGSSLVEIRCPFHRWTWDLQGRLREVPSRREFGVLNDDLPLIRVEVDSWGPLVFVNLDPGAEPLAEFLDPVPADSAWADLDTFHCTAAVSVSARCNWKALIDGFSETYHVQGIHREMLAMCDDVNGPQQIWRRHGKLEQPYGLPSPRLGDRPDDQQVWNAFVQIMGNRIGRDLDADAGPAPAVAPGSTMRDAIAAIIRERASAQGLDYSHFTLDQTLNMSQYNLFPNITVLVFSDMLNVVRARPGATHLDSYMDAFTFERRPRTANARSRPFELELDPTGELPLGLVLNQDLANFAGSQRGMHQPGLTHLMVSPTEECRIVNLHRNLEDFLDISPSELTGL